MALTTGYATCRHCDQPIGLRTYAAPYSPDPDERLYGVKLWTAGNGAYPGDQRVCESHTLDDGYSWGAHEPAGSTDGTD